MRIALYSLVAALSLANAALIGWNDGWSIGARYGYDTAIVQGRVKVECNFKMPIQPVGPSCNQVKPKK